MINNFKYLAYLVLVIGFSVSRAGAYDDFFKAVTFDDNRSVERLLAQGFDPNSRDEKGQSPLVLSLREGSFKVAKLLLAQPKIDLEQANAVGETALMMAALKGQLDWLQTLLDRGAKPERPEALAWTALHYAASGPEPRAVQLLLSRGALINARSPNGSTPLMMAARYGAIDSATLLLKSGADAKLRNEQQWDAADFAKSAGRDPLAAQLLMAAGR